MVGQEIHPDKASQRMEEIRQLLDSLQQLAAEVVQILVTLMLADQGGVQQTTLVDSVQVQLVREIEEGLV